MGSKENKVVKLDDYYIIHVDGAPLHLHRESNEDRRECGPETCKLVTKDDYRYGHSEEFRIPTLAGVKHFLLRGNTEWYNSCAERPVWPRGMIRDQMTVVSVVVTTESEPIQVDVPEVVEISDLTRNFNTMDLSAENMRSLGIEEKEYKGEIGHLVGVYVCKDERCEHPSPQAMQEHLAGKLVNHGMFYRQFVRICPIEGSEDYCVILRNMSYVD